MASTPNLCEDNGAATGSPAHGTTRSGIGNTTWATDVNFKNVDDCTANSGTAYSSSPITYGNNSYTKYQYINIGGTFDQVLTGLYAHTAGSLGAGLTLKGTVTSTYATPSTTTNAALTTDMTSAISISSGLSFNFSSTGPEAASPTSSSTANPSYSQYGPLQLQTTTSAAPGDTTSITITWSYLEN